MKHTEWTAKFEQYALGMAEKHQIPGMAVGIAVNGSPIFEGGFGFRHVEERLEVTMDTVFGIASITKSFTCAAIMTLQEQGKLSVHDPVIRYLPEFRTPDPAMTGKITVHHFMTHTSGIPPLPSIVHAMKRSLDADPSKDDYAGLNFRTTSHESIDTYEGLMAYMADQDYELLGPPGTQFSYSNDCYGLLGCIVERVSGIKYQDYVEQTICLPAGMNRTSFDVERLAGFRDIVMPYASRTADGVKTVYAAPVWWEAPAMCATGFLRSTAADMMKYMELYRNKGKVGKQTILTENSVAQMMAPHTWAEPGKSYGYGLQMYRHRSGFTMVEHGGGLKAISSRMCIVPEIGATAIVLTNLSDVPAAKIALAAFHCMQGMEPDSPPAVWNGYGAMADELKECTGKYVSRERADVHIDSRNGKLIYATMGTTYEAKPVVERDLFLVERPDEPIVLRFIRDEQGQVVRLLIGSRQMTKERDEV